MEFALSEIPSHGVGRISNLFMYPMTFFEFLENTKGIGLVEQIKESSVDKPIDIVLHNKIFEGLPYKGLWT